MSPRNSCLGTTIMPSDYGEQPVRSIWPQSEPWDFGGVQTPVCSDHCSQRSERYILRATMPCLILGVSFSRNIGNTSNSRQQTDHMLKSPLPTPNPYK